MLFQNSFWHSLHAKGAIWAINIMHFFATYHQNLLQKDIYEKNTKIFLNIVLTHEISKR